MYQVFDPELFGLPPAPPLPPPPPVDVDFTLQHCRDPGEGGIDEVLSWLGLPQAGQMRELGEDPGGGGWGWRDGERGDARGPYLGGQLMDTETDDYIDYSCFSSGLMSPDLDSEFFSGRPSMSSSSAYYPGIRVQDAVSAYPWEYSAIPGSLPGLLDRPPSPLFSGFRFGDNQYPVVDVEGPASPDEFDYDAAAKVKEIARYLASFELRTWSPDVQSPVKGSVTSGNNQELPFSTAASTPAVQTTPIKAIPTIRHQQVNGPMGVFHPGFDDSSCGLENTMVNPNEVFPDRAEKSDHQYASRGPIQDSPGPHGATTCRLPSKPSPGLTKPAGSVLEALLRSNEPIDPNKGSGAALALERSEEPRLGDQVNSRMIPERMLKKILTEGRKEEVRGRNHRTGGVDPRRGVRGTGDQRMTFCSLTPGYALSQMNAQSGLSGGQQTGFPTFEADVEDHEQMELSRDFGEILRDTDDVLLGVASVNRSPELLRFL